MHKPKIRIGKRAVVRDIRAGLDDADIMRAYKLTARGLEKLFAKLTAAGQISPSELENRALRSQHSHMVELIDLPSSPLSKAVIRTPDAVADIQRGMDDTALMEKYNLSARGLEHLFRKLVETGTLRKSDLSARYAAARNYVGAPLEDEDFAPIPRASRRTGIFRRYAAFWAGLTGLVGGVVLLAAVLLLINGVDLPFGTPRRSGLETTVTALQKQAEEMIAILEEIIRHQPMAEFAGMSPNQSVADEYQKCLDDCEKSLPRPDEVDKVLVLNCKKGCMGKYSERAKKIWHNFYQNTRGR